MRGNGLSPNYSQGNNVQHGHPSLSPSPAARASSARPLRRLTVGFCENGAGYGGAIISLAAMLERRGPEIEPVLYTSLDTEPYRRLERVAAWRHVAPVALLDAAAMKRRGLPLASALENLFNLAPTVLKYYRAFRRDRIDLVYLNNDASCNAAAMVAARLAGLPMVLHARGFHADTRGTRWAISCLDHCMPVSRAVEAELLQLGLPAERSTVVHEGLDLDSFAPRPASERIRAEFGFSPGQPLITLVGGLIDWKGQDVLLDAAPRILQRYPDARILLVGAAYGRDDSYARTIARRVAEPALAGKVLLLGGRQDVPDILSVSSVVLHASTLPEPFGRTFLEGMALGRPVIASGEGGPLDVIEDGVDGLLVTPRDPGLLADAVLRILDDPALAQRLGANGAIKARQFSIDKHTQAVAAVLQDVAARRAPEGAHPSQPGDAS